MKATSARQNPSGPSATSMNGRRLPIGVWNVSLQGPITSGSVKREQALGAEDDRDQRARVGEPLEQRRQVRRRRRQREREPERAEAEDPRQAALSLRQRDDVRRDARHLLQLL